MMFYLIYFSSSVPLCLYMYNSLVSLFIMSSLLLISFYLCLSVFFNCSFYFSNLILIFIEFGLTFFGVFQREESLLGVGDNARLSLSLSFSLSFYLTKSLSFMTYFLRNSSSLLSSFLILGCTSRFILAALDEYFKVLVVY